MAGDFEQALTLARNFEGWMSDGQAHRLWEAASRVRSGGQIVEIGSFRGRSTSILARSAPPGTAVVAIDPHAGGDRGPQEIAGDAELGRSDFEVFHANLRAAGVEDRVRHVRLPSDAAHAEVSEPIDLLYIDGAHRYLPASRDIENWGRRVSPNGTMLIHDSYNAIGVMLAQLRLLLLSREWRYVGRTRSLAEFRREDLGAVARIANAGRQLVGIPYFLRNLLIKVMLTARLEPVTHLLGHTSGEWPY